MEVITSVCIWLFSIKETKYFEGWIYSRWIWIAREMFFIKKALLKSQPNTIYRQTSDISRAVVSNTFFLINQTLTSSFSTIHLVECIGERQLQDETRKHFVVFDASDIRGLVAMVCSLNDIRKRNSIHYYFTDSRKTCMLHAQFSTELSGYKNTTHISFTVAAIMLFMAMPSVTHLNASNWSPSSHHPTRGVSL